MSIDAISGDQSVMTAIPTVLIALQKNSISDFIPTHHEHPHPKIRTIVMDKRMMSEQPQLQKIGELFV